MGLGVGVGVGVGIGVGVCGDIILFFGLKNRRPL